MSNLIDQQKADLAAAFRWAARLNFHEAVANHFSFAVNDDGTRFIMNPNQRHFSLIKASDIIEFDANDPASLTGPDALEKVGKDPKWLKIDDSGHGAGSLKNRLELYEGLLGFLDSNLM